MIKYHPQNSLDNIAQIHYAGIKNIIDTRLKLLLEFLRYRKDVKSLSNSRLSELENKILSAGNNLETACMYRIAGKYRGGLHQIYQPRWVLEIKEK